MLSWCLDSCVTNAGELGDVGFPRRQIAKLEIAQMRVAASAREDLHERDTRREVTGEPFGRLLDDEARAQMLFLSRDFELRGYRRREA